MPSVLMYAYICKIIYLPNYAQNYYHGRWKDICIIYHWGGTWNTSQWKRRTHLFYIVNDVAADSLTTWGAVVSHYGDVMMNAMASQITRLTIVCSTVYSGAGQRKHQSSASLAFVRGIHRWPVNSPHKGPVTRKMCPFDDVIMSSYGIGNVLH